MNTDTDSESEDKKHEVATTAAYAIKHWERDNGRDADKADMVPFIIEAINAFSPGSAPAKTVETEDDRTEVETMLALRAADKMAWICDDWVQRHVIDARSALADARLSYGEPFKYRWSKLEAPSDPSASKSSPATSVHGAAEGVQTLEEIARETASTVLELCSEGVRVSYYSQVPAIILAALTKAASVHPAPLAVRGEQERLENETPLAYKAGDAPRQIASSRYVVGFMFDPTFQRVALIRKNKPQWQAGLLNGIGGKIELGEEPAHAMRREFIEEAGLDRFTWSHFATLAGTNNDGATFELVCFWTSDSLNLCRSQESEKIEIIDVATIAEREDTIGNLPWLITLARDCGAGVFPPRIVKADYGPSVVNGNDGLEQTRVSSSKSVPATLKGEEEAEQEPRKEHCIRCNQLTDDWVDTEQTHGRCCRPCESIISREAEQEKTSGIPEADVSAEGASKQKWLPIESAPKDGTIIDLWANGNRRTDCYWGKPDHSCGEAGSYCDSDWHSDEPGWVDGCFGEFLHVQDATHWMPLPAAPSVGRPERGSITHQVSEPPASSPDTPAPSEKVSAALPEISDLEIATFLTEFDEGKHPLSPEDEIALERSRPELFKLVKRILATPSAALPGTEEKTDLE